MKSNDMQHCVEQVSVCKINSSVIQHDGARTLRARPCMSLINRSGVQHCVKRFSVFKRFVAMVCSMMKQQPVPEPICTRLIAVVNSIMKQDQVCTILIAVESSMTKQVAVSSRLVAV